MRFEITSWGDHFPETGDSMLRVEFSGTQRLAKSLGRRGSRTEATVCTESELGAGKHFGKIVLQRE